jgi:hypothetical protein
MIKYFNENGDGGKLKLANEAILGLLLTFYCDKMCQKSLCMEFGIPITLLQAEIALHEALDEIPAWPTLEEQREWADSKYPFVRGRWDSPSRSHSSSSPSNSPNS